MENVIALSSTQSYLNSNYAINQLLTKLNNKIQELEARFSERGTIIVLPSNSGLEFIPVHNIIRCQADGSYCTIYQKNEKPIYIAKTLKYVSSLLPQKGFLKTHQSHLVNKKCIKRLVRNDGKYLVLFDGTVVPISRSNARMVEQKISA